VQGLATLLSGAISREFVSDSGKLTIGELIHAGIVNVVHEVSGGVISGIRGAGINDTGASVVGLLLSGGVTNTITTTNLAASSLEGVVQAHPVTHLVSGSVTLVVVGGRSSGHGGVQHNNAIHLRR
jgi:3-oxoacyl-ACP reductase-like protein